MGSNRRRGDIATWWMGHQSVRKRKTMGGGEILGLIGLKTKRRKKGGGCLEGGNGGSKETKGWEASFH